MRTVPENAIMEAIKAPAPSERPGARPKEDESLSTSDDTTFKVCTKCKIRKPSCDFHSNKRNRDGLQSNCKTCQKAAFRAYQRANPEKEAARRAAWREANRDHVQEYATTWRDANREHMREYSRAWRKANPEKNAAKTRNYQACKNNAPGTHTAEDVQAQYDAQKGRCYWCKSKLEDYHVDHVVPLSQGGSNWPSNLVIACPTCNISKNNKHPMEFAGVLF